MNNEKKTWQPRGLTGFFVRGVMKAGSDPASPENRQALGMLESRASIAISVLLTVIKVVLGMISGSISLLADAINNMSDIGTSVVILLGFRISRKPRDNEHPFGHGRSELISGLVLSIILIVIGLEVGHAGFTRLLNPEPVYAPGWLVAIILTAVILKIWMAWFAAILARETGSMVLRADAWNHGFDIMSSALVLLAMLCTRVGWGAVDGWAALLVAGFIINTGIRCARDVISPLLGEAPSPEDIRMIQEAAAALVGVRGVHDIIVNTYGDTRIVSLHIEVDASRSAMEIHDLSEAVEAAVEKGIPCKAIVHVDPVDRDHPAYESAEKVVRRVAEEDSRILGFHDLRVVGHGKSLKVSLDIIVSKVLAQSEYESIVEGLKRAMNQAFKRLELVTVTVETEYSDEKATKLGILGASNKS